MGVDQGTTGTTVLLLDEDWNLAASSHKEHKQYYPQPGWVEQNPREIWSTQVSVLTEALAVTGAMP